MTEIKLKQTCLYYVLVLRSRQPVGKRHSKDQWETKDKEVSGGIQVHELKIGNTDSSDHTKHDHEYPAYYGVGNSGEQGAKLAEYSKQDH